MMNRLLAAASLGIVLAAGATAQQRLAPFNESITQADLRADLFFLAGDGFRGRLTSTPENALAAEFIKSRFERMGLAPAGADRTFFHPYNLMTATLGSPNAMSVEPGGASGASSERGQTTLVPRPGQDFYPQRFSAAGRSRGALVFAGFGIVDKDAGHDDYRGAALEGNVVLVLDHEPGEFDPKSPFDGVVTAQSSTPLFKALYAQDRGAVAILFVQDAHNHPGPLNFEAAARSAWPETPPHLDTFTLASWMERVRIPAAQVSPGLAALLIRRSGKTLEDLGRLAETRGGITPVPLGVVVDLTAAVDRHVVPDRNVLAAIEGSDPKLKDEWVVVSAHYDHNGAEGDLIWNGADDDGSGTVALLEIAEAYGMAARAGQRPRRSVLFATWNSEERGLLGAWAFAEAPPFPLERIVAVLNMDMLGRNEEVIVGGGTRFRGLDLQTAESNSNAVNVIGTTFSRDLSATIQEGNETYRLDLRLRYDNNASNLLRRSDHWPFLQKGVPGVWFHTGLHPDYHTVYDRPERINYEKMEKIARLVHHVSWTLAQQDGRPRFDGRANTRRTSNQ